MSINRIIAIDGPAASGKGTLARKIAGHLDLAYMDTGLLYRAVAHNLLMHNGNQDLEAAIAAARSVAAQNPAALDKDMLRAEDVGVLASRIAAIGEVRAILLDMQRDFASRPPGGLKGAVLDGRDIGTHVCPDADIKLYITARAEIRAQRRLKELLSADPSATYEAVLRDMRDRDSRDAARTDQPMKPADDAITLDTSDLDAGAALAKALEIIRDKGGFG